MQQRGHTTALVATPAEPREAIDPVCGMTVSTAGRLWVEHEGQRVHFCSEHCVHAFQAEPDRYAAASPSLPLGVPQAIVVGAHDSQFAPFGRSYFKMALARGEKQLRLIDVPAAGHFDVIAPPTSTWPIVVTALHDVLAGP